MLRYGNSEIDFAFYQPEPQLLQRIQPVGAGGRNFGLHPLEGV